MILFLFCQSSWNSLSCLLSSSFEWGSLFQVYECILLPHDSSRNFMYIINVNYDHDALINNWNKSYYLSFVKNNQIILNLLRGAIWPVGKFIQVSGYMDSRNRQINIPRASWKVGYRSVTLSCAKTKLFEGCLHGRKSPPTCCYAASKGGCLHLRRCKLPNGSLDTPGL